MGKRRTRRMAIILTHFEHAAIETAKRRRLLPPFIPPTLQTSNATPKYCHLPFLPLATIQSGRTHTTLPISLFFVRIVPFHHLFPIFMRAVVYSCRSCDATVSTDHSDLGQVSSFNTGSGSVLSLLLFFFSSGVLMLHK